MTDLKTLAADAPKPVVNEPIVTPAMPQTDKGAETPGTPEIKTSSK